MRSSSSLRAVSMSTAVSFVDGPERSSSSTSYPDFPGSIRSRMMRAGRSCLAARTASMPSDAVETRYPCFTRWYATSAMMSGSSSTTRMRSPEVVIGLLPSSCRLCRGEPALDSCDEHLDGHRIVSATRHDDVRVALAGFDELEVHRLHGREVLLEDVLERAPPLHHVALDAANQPHVGVRVHEHLHVTERAHALVHEEQDAVHDDHVGRLHALRFR